MTTRKKRMLRRDARTSLAEAQEALREAQEPALEVTPAVAAAGCAEARAEFHATLTELWKGRHIHPVYVTKLNEKHWFPVGLVLDYADVLRVQAEMQQITCGQHLNRYAPPSELAECDCCCGDAVASTMTIVHENGGGRQNWCTSCREHAYYYGGRYHIEEQRRSEEDERRRRDSMGVAQYHAYRVDPKRPRELADNVIGPELESYWPQPAKLTAWMKENGMVPEKGWKAERDGSLDSTNGVELVSAPVPYEKIIEESEKDNQWFALFLYAKKSGARAWDMGKGYGMHLSLNRAKMDQNHGIKFSRLINSTKAMSEKIAGRRETQYARYYKPRTVEEQEYASEKYLACSFRSENRVEVRIFRASWKWERFVRNCQYVEAVRRYTKDCKMSDKELDEKPFLDWLVNQSDFAILSSFLCPNAPTIEVAEATE